MVMAMGALHDGRGRGHRGEHPGHDNKSIKTLSTMVGGEMLLQKNAALLVCSSVVGVFLDIPSRELQTSNAAFCCSRVSRYQYQYQFCRD